jgi:IrrE N-terminal-like domain
VTDSAATMLVLDLIELEDYKTPSDVVEEILRQNPDLTYPTPLERFVELAGIESISELTTEGFEGMLITNTEKSRGAILVKSANSPRRRRFTIAHELGHFLLPWHRQERFSCQSSDIKDHGNSRSVSTEHATIETEANTFASELLMPTQAVKTILAKFDMPSLVDLTDLSDTFDVSFEAAVHRYKALTQDAVAFIFSYNNVVRYWVKSKVMPYALRVRKDHALPISSPSRRQSEYVSDWEKIPAHIWLEPHRELVAPPGIFEQTICQLSGYKVTMLYLDSLLGLEKSHAAQSHAAQSDVYNDEPDDHYAQEEVMYDVESVFDESH